MSRIEPSQVKPSRVEPSRVGSSRVESSRVESSRVESAHLVNPLEVGAACLLAQWALEEAASVVLLGASSDDGAWASSTGALHRGLIARRRTRTVSRPVPDLPALVARARLACRRLGLCRVALRQVDDGRRSTPFEPAQLGRSMARMRVEKGQGTDGGGRTGKREQERNRGRYGERRSSGRRKAGALAAPRPPRSRSRPGRGGVPSARALAVAAVWARAQHFWASWAAAALGHTPRQELPRPPRQIRRPPRSHQR